MLIKEIRFNNLGPFRGEHVLTLSTDRDRPITLIGGMNGAGKTTILEAVLVLLYGQRSQVWRKSSSYKDYIQSCMNNNVSNNEDTWIQISLLIKSKSDNNTNSDTYIDMSARRSWRIDNGKLIETVNVWKNGREDDYLASNWDLYAEELVPYGVSGLFFFDGEKISKLAEEDEGSKTLKTAISSLLGIDLIDRLISNLRRIISNHDWKISHNKEDERINDIQTRIEETIREHLKISQNVISLDTTIGHNKSKLKEKEEVYLQQGGHYFDNRNKLIDEKNRLNELISNTKGSMIQLSSGPLPLHIVKPLLERIKKSISCEDNIRQAKTILPFLEEYNIQILDILASSASDSILENIRSSMDCKESILVRLSEKDPLFPHYQITHQLNSINKLATTLKKDTARLIEKHEKYQYELDQVEVQLHFDVDESEVSSILQDIKKLTKHILQLEEQKLSILKEKNEIEKQLGLLEQEQKCLLKKKLENELEVEGAQRIVRYAFKSIEVLSTFKERLIIKKISLLEENINKAFMKLIGKKSLVSLIKIDPLTLRMFLVHTNGNEIPKSQLSEGEKQMLALAFLWGLAESSGHTLPVIIDTPMARLDSTHRINFIENYLPSSGRQVIVLSTDEEIKKSHIEILESKIGKMFLLVFDDELGDTEIKQGYFSEVNSYDSKAS
ncbi:MAG: hypothetical protein VR68_00755 [Peptococcaceae bacterium BRH_c4a]|nr:MAG: hypothetical protein VR68_00755 [Peptococcaceae bacterium BRH_c4a]